MLWLHFGMSKTGSTALQGFLNHNQKALRGQGLCYLEAGRMRPDGTGRPTSSHNQIVFDITRGGANIPFYRDALTAEYKKTKDRTSIVSSEMFFSTKHQGLAQVFADIPPEEMRILVYCRQYDDYFEADYKQVAKNGRMRLDASAYIQKQMQQIKDSPDRFNFSGRIASIREAFPKVEIQVANYDRDSLTNGNLVDDVLVRLDVNCPDSVSTASNSNPSLSRIGSEAFGVLTKVVGRKSSRRLRRVAATEKTMQRRHDVLEVEEREFINAHLSAADKEFCAEFFPDTPTIFRDRKLTDEMIHYRRDTPQNVEDMKVAMEYVLKLALEAQSDPRVTGAGTGK